MKIYALPLWEAHEKWKTKRYRGATGGEKEIHENNILK